MAAPNEKHLEFIQSVVSRMANNSFLLKGWSVTIVAAVFALAAKEENHNFIVLAYIPIAAFAALDSYYLFQEKMFRILYDQVASGIIVRPPFTLNTKLIVRDKVEGLGCPDWISAFFSLPIWMFYGTLAAAVLIVGHLISS